MSAESSFVESIRSHLADFPSFDRFYRRLLHDVHRHRAIDTVASPIDVRRILSNEYDDGYLNISCFETASDLLVAHGYNGTHLNLSSDELQALLPAVLNVANNPGCERRSPALERDDVLHIWMLGVLLIVMMKGVHFLVFLVARHAQHGNADKQRRSVKHRLWLQLCSNAFTSGLILGTIVYHLIPHIYQIPDEDYDYTYMYSATVLLCGIILFCLVEKVLRLRFNVGAVGSRRSLTHPCVEQIPSQSSVLVMKIHQVSRCRENGSACHEHIDLTAPLSTEDPARPNENDVQKDEHPVFLSHLIHDFSNDLVYGCGLPIALASDRLIGLVLWLVMLSEGFRRHAQFMAFSDRKYGFSSLYFSVVFLLLGYMFGGIVIRLNEQFNSGIEYLSKEYIYSMVYGALLYTALVILIPELNDLGIHLQAIVKAMPRPSKRGYHIRTRVFICQSLCLLLGVAISLAVAILWRYHHLQGIADYVCSRDPSRPFCPPPPSLLYRV